MADSIDRIQEPLDSSPLDLGQLSDDELAIIIYIERRLYEAQNTDKGVAKHQRYYLAPVQNRASRVLLLDGGRGTGKTSLLLTLVDRWNRWSREGVARDTFYEERIQRLRSDPNFAQGRHDFEIPTHVSVVGRILDFDPLPPEIPLVAGIMQAWRPLAQEYDRLSGFRDDCDDEGDTLMDLWHGLFRMAAVGWTSIPRNRGLLEQVLDRQEQVEDWQRLDEQWRNFVDEVIKRGKCLPEPDRLSTEPVFVVMIDDVDLQVGRIRELLPALRLLYHPKVIFLVAAHQHHLIDMLTLDFLGQQNRLANRQFHEDALQVGDRDRWASELAKASFQKVFPLRDRWPLRQLSLREVLEFPDDRTNLRAILNTWPSHYLDSYCGLAIGDYLHAMGVAMDEVSELPSLMTYRTVHQVFQRASAHGPQGSDAFEVLRYIIGSSVSDDLVRITGIDGRWPAIEYRLIGEISALFRPDLIEPTSGQSDIVMSARPDFVYHRDPSSPAIRMSAGPESAVNFTSALVAVSLREDGYGIGASGLRWNARIALAWTRVRILDRNQSDPYLDLAFQWRFNEHPSPMRLLRWTKDWANFVQNLHARTEERLDRIVYAWIYYQLVWLGAPMDGVLDPFNQSFNTENSWDTLLEREPASKNTEDKLRWRTQTLPLLARPEIGLNKAVQQRLLKFVSGSTALDLLVFLCDQRRRLITDAILSAADEAALSAKDAEDLVQVERAIRTFERRHRDSQGGDSPWWTIVEVRAKANRSPGDESETGQG